MSVMSLPWVKHEISCPLYESTSTKILEKKGTGSGTFLSVILILYIVKLRVFSPQEWGLGQTALKGKGMKLAIRKERGPERDANSSIMRRCIRWKPGLGEDRGTVTFLLTQEWLL